MPTTIPSLEATRLFLRPLELNDAAAVQETFPRWEIVKFLGSHIPWPYPPDGALTFIRDQALPAMKQGREWHWSIRPKSEPEQLIGLISLMDTEGDNRGFWLSPEWQGMGLMSEAVDVVTAYWFEALEKPLLRVRKATANGASRRLSEKGGMRVIATGARDYVCGQLPMEIWEGSQEEWRTHTQRQMNPD